MTGSAASLLLPRPVGRGEGWGEGSALARGIQRQKNSLGPPLPSPLLPRGRRGRSRRISSSPTPENASVWTSSSPTRPSAAKRRRESRATSPKTDKTPRLWGTSQNCSLHPSNPHMPRLVKNCRGVTMGISANSLSTSRSLSPVTMASALAPTAQRSTGRSLGCLLYTSPSPRD